MDSSHPEDITDHEGLDMYEGIEEEDTEHAGGGFESSYRGGGDEDETEHTNGMSYHDELHSCDSKSVTGSTTATNKEEQVKRIDHDETRMVNRSKIIVDLVISVSEVVAGTLTYMFVKEEEKSWYEDEVRQTKKYQRSKWYHLCVLTTIIVVF